MQVSAWLIDIGSYRIDPLVNLILTTIYFGLRFSDESYDMVFDLSVLAVDEPDGVAPPLAEY